MPSPQPAKAAKRTAHEPNLLFRLGGVPCRLELKRLRAVLPWVTLEPSQAKGVLGNLNFRGEPVPVIDLEAMLSGVPATHALGSRILLMECTAKGGRIRTVGTVVSEAFALTRDAAELNDVERFDPCEVLPALLAGLA